MSAYFRIMSTPAGRIVRLIFGILLVVGGILEDRHGSLMWLLIVPGMVGMLAALLDLNPLAITFGLPLIGGDLRERLQAARTRETGLGDLPFVGDSLMRGSSAHGRK